MFTSIFNNTGGPENSLTSFANTLPNIVWITDKFGKMQFCNDYGLKYLGFENSKVSDEEWASTVHPDEFDSIKTLWEEATVNKKAFTNTQRQKNKAGDFEWFKVSANPFFDESGEIKNWIGISINIDEEIRSSQELKAANTRLDLSIRNSKSGIWDWDLKKDIIVYNDNWWEMLGFKKGDLEENTAIWERLLHEDDKKKALETLDDHIKGKTDFYESIYRLKTKSNEWLWIYDTGRVIDRGANGEALRFIGMQQDFTSRKFHEDFIKRSESNMRILAESAQTLMELRSQDEIREHCVDEIYKYIGGRGIVTYTSYEDGGKTWRIIKIKGYSNLLKKISKLLGRPIEGLSGPTDKQSLEAKTSGKLVSYKPNIPAVLKGVVGKALIHALKGIVNLEKVYAIGITKNTFVHGNIAIIPKDLNLELDQNFIETIVYQTASALERKEIEEKILLQNRELSDLNSEMDLVIKGLSHDLKAPINTAKGLLDLAEEETNVEFNSELRSHLQKSLNRLDDITDDLLGMVYNHRSSLEKTKINIKKIIAELIENQENESGFSESEWKIKVEQKADFYLDTKRIKLILRNLFSNSIKYRDKNKSKNIIEIKAICKNDYLKIHVKDNGIGMKKEQLAKVFDMFYRADHSTRGIGLGLHIIKQTVQKLDGTIEINSVYQEGTEIIFSIPNMGK